MSGMIAIAKGKRAKQSERKGFLKICALTQWGKSLATSKILMQVGVLKRGLIVNESVPTTAPTTQVKTGYRSFPRRWNRKYLF